MENPVYGERRSMIFVAGDNPDARATACGLVRDIGLEAVAVGKLSAARLLEPMAMLWIKMASGENWGPDLTFALLRRDHA